MKKRLKAEAAWVKSWFDYTSYKITEEEHAASWHQLMEAREPGYRADCADCRAGRAHTHR